MHRHARRLGLCLALALLAPLPAGAQQPPPAPLDPVAQEAQQTFQEGREALKKGELGRAIGLFRRSQELDPSPGTLLNLAKVEEQLGKVASAAEHFQLAMKQLPETDDRYPVAKEGVTRLAPRVPSLRIDRAVGAPATMSVKLDGNPVAASNIGVDQPIDPGTYQVSTSVPGHEERRYEVKLIESSHLTLAVEPGKDLAPIEAPPPPPRAGFSATQMVGLAAGGVGLAGLGIGAATGILAIAKKGEAASACPMPSRCTPDGLQAAAGGKALAGVSTASFAVGAAGIGAGVILLLVGREKTPPPRTAVSPLVLPGGGGVAAMGAF